MRCLRPICTRPFRAPDVSSVMTVSSHWRAVKNPAWSKTSGAVSTQLPAPMQTSRSASTRMREPPLFLWLERLPGDRQRLEAVDHGQRTELDLLERYRQAQTGKPAQQRGKGDAHLEAGPRRAPAVLVALSESDVRRRVPGQVEHVRAGGHRLISIGGRKRDRDRVAGLDDRAADGDVLDRGADDPGVHDRQ